jgi:hypothetical protein
MSPTTADRSDRASTAVISARSFAFTFDDDDDDGVSSTRTSFVVLDGLIGGSTLTELNTISHASTEANGNSISLLLFRVRRRIFKAQKSHARIQRRGHNNNTGPKEKEVEKKTKVVSFFFKCTTRERETFNVLEKRSFLFWMASSLFSRSFKFEEERRRRRRRRVFLSLSRRRERKERRHTSSVLLSSHIYMRPNNREIFDFSIPKRETKRNEKNTQIKITHVE